MDTTDAKNCGTLKVCVRESCDEEGKIIIQAHVRVYEATEKPAAGEGPAPPPPSATPVAHGTTRGSDGCIEFPDMPPGRYYAIAQVGLETSNGGDSVDLAHGECQTLTCLMNTGFALTTHINRDDRQPLECTDVEKGKTIVAQLDLRTALGMPEDSRFWGNFGNMLGHKLESFIRQAAHPAGVPDTPKTLRYQQAFTPTVAGTQTLHASVTYQNGTAISGRRDLLVRENVQQISGDISVTMRRAAAELTDDLPLWVVIRNSTNALSFNNYAAFLDHLFCGERSPRRLGPPDERHFNSRVTAFRNLAERRFLPYTDSDAYRVLKVATEAFVMVNCGVFLHDYEFHAEDHDYVLGKVGVDVELRSFWLRYLKSVNGHDDATLPYLALVRQKLRDVSIKTNLFDNARASPPEKFEECSGILASKLTSPCLLELIWSYWHEEGMLVQTLNSVTRRFQNVRISNTGLDPLANFEVDPLRPLANLIWAYTQDEQHRLSVVRRNYEYDHEYGLRLEGKAVGDQRTADTRSKFLEAFHHLLYRAAQFHKQDDNTTIVADGFPVLNALKEVHLILAEGAHNQFGDLPSTARIEMLMQQWLLARSEFREFLPTRVMVAYPEAWMDRVDAMKRLQGWSDTNVLHFRNLGVFGEQLLLTVRYGNWSVVHDAAQGANWARFWRPQVQGYVHAYRAVSGVDHSVIAGDARVDATLPSTLLRRRLSEQQQRRT
jgi:hypothetical protein